MVCRWTLSDAKIHNKSLQLTRSKAFLKSTKAIRVMEAARTSETSVDNHFTRQYNPEDSSEHNTGLHIKFMVLFY
jgi:hypothetical protein